MIETQTPARVSCRCPSCGAELSAVRWSRLIPAEAAAALAAMTYAAEIEARCVRCRADRRFPVTFTAASA